MKPETTARALACLPATREELAERLGMSYRWASLIARHLLAKKLAEEWGSGVTRAGTLRPVLRAL